MRALVLFSILFSSILALAEPPPGKGHGQSPAKWDIQSVESDLKELDKLARKPRWREPNFQTLYRNYLVSAKKRIESIRSKDPSWPLVDYQRDLLRYQQVFDQATAERHVPVPPQVVVSATEQAVLDRVKAASAELVQGRLLVSGQGGYFDDDKKLEAFFVSAERADYRQIRSEIDRDLTRLPNLRTNPAVEKFLGFEDEFKRTLDALLLPELGRLLDAAYANRTRNKPYGVAKARAAIDLIRAVRLVTDHTALTGLENQGRANLNALAQGLYPNGFHAENATRVLLSRAPIQVRRERREDVADRVAAGQHLYGMAYLDKPLRDIVPPNQKVLIDTRILVDDKEIGVATRMLPSTVLGSDVLPVPLIPTKAEVEDDGPAVIAKVLSNVMGGRYRLKVVVRLRTEAGWNREVATGRAILFANVAGLEAWSRLAVELQPSEAPTGVRPPLSPTGPAVIALKGAPPPPPPPPPPTRVTPPPPPPPPPPRGPDRSALAGVGLPEEKMQDAGILKEAYAAIQQRFGKRPLKMGFASYWLKGTEDGNKNRRVTAWLVWPDEDNDGVAQVESFDLVAHWRSSRWGALEIVGPSKTGPRHLILTSKVN